MKKLPFFTFVFILLYSCNYSNSKGVNTNTQTPADGPIRLYSKEVKDTFSVFVSMPLGYDPQKDVKYPVVYLLDANLYFDMVAVTINKYAEVGMLRPAILIGVGYKDLQTMDSLRSRDYTYPLAIPEYEMSVSGKADKFLSFMNNELVPKIDSEYPVDKTQRILMGHSLGGYFTLYALHRHLLNKNGVFSGYVAASPSTHYNNNYILSEFEKLNEGLRLPVSSYITFGGLEDDEEELEMLKTDKIFLSLERSLKNKLRFKGDTYSNLDHMDTPLPSFIKGLQLTLEVEE